MSKKRIWQSVFFLFFLILFVIIFNRYRQSDRLKEQGEKTLQLGQAQDAVLLFKKALDLFPLRKDVADDLDGARLVLRSTLEYAQIYQINEIQFPPPITYWPPLKLGELFVPILMYHHIRENPKPGDLVYDVLNVNSHQLDEQLNYFAAHNYHTVTLGDLSGALNGKIRLPENPVILTFDDGYRNFYENAFPLLKKYKMKAIVFVITSVVGSSPYLTWDQIIEMDKSGLVEFGAHTIHHPNLPDISQEVEKEEIIGSKKDLENHLKKPVIWFAYPYGSYSNFIIKTVKDAGFTGAVSTIYGAIQNKDGFYLMPRIGVDGRFTLSNLARRIKQ